MSHLFRLEKYVTNLGTLDNLVDAESRLRDVKEVHPVTLFRPATIVDAKAKPMQKINRIVGEADYLKLDIVGLDQATKNQSVYIRRMVRENSGHSMVIWNDDPRIHAIYDRLNEKWAPAVFQPGKGRNFWTGLMVDCTLNGDTAFITHDCDIKPDFYDERIILSLARYIADPRMNFQFIKASYDRITKTGTLEDAFDAETLAKSQRIDYGKNGEKETLHLAGRVVRLLMSPLVSAMEEVYGRNQEDVRNYFAYLREVGYILSGEVGLSPNKKKVFRTAFDWGLEIETLNQAMKLGLEKKDIGQPYLGIYEHKHQKVGLSDPDSGIRRMAREITKTIFRMVYSIAGKEILERDKYGLPSERSIKKFQVMMNHFAGRIEDDFISYYQKSEAKNMAYIGPLERAIVETFKLSIREAWCTFTNIPDELVPLPAFYDVDPFDREELTDIALDQNKRYIWH